MLIGAKQTSLELLHWNVRFLIIPTRFYHCFLYVSIGFFPQFKRSFVIDLDLITYVTKQTLYLVLDFSYTLFSLTNNSRISLFGIIISWVCVPSVFLYFFFSPWRFIFIPPGHVSLPYDMSGVAYRQYVYKSFLIGFIFFLIMLQNVRKSSLVEWQVNRTILILFSYNYFQF